MPPRLLTTVLVWNEVESPCRLLELLEAQGALRSEILLVDNGSDGEAGMRVRDRHPGVELLRSEENLGFAGGMNLAIHRALELGARELLLLNQDLLPEPGMLPELTRVLRARPGLAALGPALLDGASGGSPLGPQRICPWTAGYSSLPVESDAELQVAGWISGAALLLRLEALEQVGDFDEDFFLYWEDVDLCRRLRDAGWEVGVAPRARAVHPLKPDGSSPRKTYFMHRNRWTYLRKHTRGARRWIQAAATLAATARALAGHAIRARFGALRPCLLGAWDGVRGVVGPGRFREL